MQIGLAVFLGYDAGIALNTVVIRIFLMTFQASCHAVIPVTYLFDSVGIILCDGPKGVRTNVQQITAALCHDFINGGSQVANGVKCFVTAITPGMLTHRITGLGHFGKAGTLNGLVFPLRCGKITFIPTPVVDINAGLQLPNQGIESGILHLGRNIPEESINLAVIGKQLCDLIFDVFPVGFKIGFVLIYSLPLVGRGGIVAVFMVPVWVGVVKGEKHFVFLTGIGKHFQHIPPIGRVHDVVISVLGIPHAETVMMLGGKTDVLHTGPLGKQHPFLRIIVYGIKPVHQGFVLCSIQIIPGKRLLMQFRQRVNTPMDEHTKFIFVCHENTSPLMPLFWYLTPYRFLRQLTAQGDDQNTKAHQQYAGSKQKQLHTVHGGTKERNSAVAHSSHDTGTGQHTEKHSRIGNNGIKGNVVGLVLGRETDINNVACAVGQQHTHGMLAQPHQRHQPKEIIVVYKGIGNIGWCLQQHGQ